MSKAWILVVHHDSDVRDLARETLMAKALELNPGSKTQVVRAANLKEAQEEIDQFAVKSCALIVLGAATPSNRQASVGGTTREPTMEFIKKLKLPNPRLPIIVLSANPDAELSGFLRAYDLTAWVDFRLDSHWRDDLAVQTEDLLKGTADRPSGVLDVEIILGDSTPAWRLERHGLNKMEDGDYLTVDAGALDELKRKSERLSGDIIGSQWSGALDDISNDLGRLLFSANYQNQMFWAKFAEYRAEAGGQDQTRIRFTVSDSTYPVFVEAVKFGNRDKYWMLVSPIFRRHNRHSTPRQPLFQDDASRTGPVNCLVIAADPQGGILGDKTFALLRHSVAEAGAVKDILDHGGLETHVLNLAEVPGEGPALIEALYRKLKERTWHLVHFTGHVASLPRVLLDGKVGAFSESERKDVVSSLVLSPYRKVALDAANFVNKLEKTQFLFMSSCRSADGYVIASAAREQVPAVLGYRWTVNDARAAAFAQRFYTKLLSRGRSYKSLEYAFRDARRLTYENDVNDPTWASPVLMMQQRELQTA